MKYKWSLPQGEEVTNVGPGRSTHALMRQHRSGRESSWGHGPNYETTTREL